MGLETGTRIEDLVAANPVAGDDVSVGQNHLNLIKTCVKGSFPSLGATAVSATAEQLNLLTSPETNLVTSWNTRVGAVTPYAGDYDLTDLGDTYTPGKTDYDNLTYNGTYWVPTPTNKSIATLATTGAGITEIGETLLIPDGSGSANAANHIRLIIYNLQKGYGGDVWVELGDDATYAMESKGAIYNSPNRVWTEDAGARVGVASAVTNGIVDLYRQSGTNRWVVNGAIGFISGLPVYDANYQSTCNGYIELLAPADRLRVVSKTDAGAAGTDFISGSIDVRVTC